MSIEKVRAYFKPLGIEDRIRFSAGDRQVPSHRMSRATGV